MRTALEEINRAAKFAESLENLIVDKGSIATIHDGNLDHMLLVYWSLGFDLHKGMLAVMRDKFYSAGFALLRPLVEAQLRAHLVVTNAKDDVERIKDDRYRVNFDTIGAEIDASFGFQGYMERFLARASAVLHSFTQARSPIIGFGLACVKRCWIVVSTSLVSCGEARAMLQATGRPWRSAIAMILLPLPRRVGPTAEPLFSPS
jgi:hypothetical protein